MYDVEVTDWIFTRHRMVSRSAPRIREVKRGGIWPFRTVYTQVLDGKEIIFEIQKKHYRHLISIPRRNH